MDLLINILIWVIAVVPGLWLAGRLLAGKQNAKFTDALWIVVIGAVIFYFVGYALQSFVADTLGGSWLAVLISYLVLLIIWLGLVKHFFDCGWLKAFAISIIAVIIAVIIWFIIAFILVLVGLGAGWFPDPTQLI